MTSQRAPPATNPPAQPAAVPRPPPTEAREEPPTPMSPSSCATRRNAERSEASGPGAALAALPGYHTELPYATGGEESLCEVLDALKQFNTNCDSLFGNIQGRLMVERQKYESLTSRITTCGERVRDLKDRREAITVISTPKFPARVQAETNQQLIQHPDEENQVVSLYKRQPTRPTRPFAAVRNRARAAAGGGKKPTPPHNIAKPVRLDGHAEDTRPMRPVDPTEQFEFSLLVPGEESSAHPRRAAGEERGLGRLPTHLPYVSGLLLFNTRDNPYKQYTDVNLFSQNRAERLEPKETKKIGDHGNIHDPHFLTRKYGEGGDFVMIDENDVPNVYDELSGVDLPLDQIALTDHWCPDFGGHEEHPTDFSPDRDAINPSAVNRRKKEGRRGSGDSAFSTIPSVSEMATRNSAKPTKPSFKETPPMKQLPMKGPPPALRDKQNPSQLQSGEKEPQNVVGISRILEQRDAHAATVNTQAAMTVVAAQPEPARETTPNDAPKKLPANVTVLPPTLASNIPQPPPLDKLLAGKAAPPPVQHKVPIPPPPSPQLLGKSTGKIPTPPPLSTLLATKVPPKPLVAAPKGVPKPPAPTTQQAALVDQLKALKKTDVLIKTNRGGGGGASESKVKTAAMNNFTNRLRLLREGVQGKDEFSDDDDGDVPPPAAAPKKKEPAAVARPTPLAAAPADAPKNKVPPPPLPVVAAPRPGAKLGSRRQFKEENSDSDWDC